MNTIALIFLVMGLVVVLLTVVQVSLLMKKQRKEIMKSEIEFKAEAKRMLTNAKSDYLKNTIEEQLVMKNNA